jgi:hypothetical protein
MKKIAIIHFLPIEYYPPVTNFLNFLMGKNVRCKIYSTHNTRNRDVYVNKYIDIVRFNPSENGSTKLSRIFWYFYFNIGVLISLVRSNPDVVVYYDTFSSMPAYWYFKYFGKKSKLWIHSHEYYSKEIYERATVTINYYHKKEQQYLYKVAKGISQTNQMRIQLFQKDNPNIDDSKLHVLPNYPPSNWSNCRYQEIINSPVKVVYVGGLSLKNSYIKEFCEWVILQKGAVIFDIYSYFIDKETTNYLLKLNSKYISFKPGGKEYDSLPQLFSNYNVGLIVFKDFDENYRYNETNKLFEYLVCNLDVWFSENLQGILPHVSNGFYPKVIDLNFNCLAEIKLNSLISRSGLNYKKMNYTCETVFEFWFERLLGIS